ncbi:MAG: nitroreductase [Methanomicrobiales archaeon HGW-Methanomicrobiales-4]|nr:MAG: nitroreductase [Methanomicrobiales archaeon HGW-Methanomicrobiales-4]
MTEIIIDASQCSGCGTCIQACPYCILELKEDIASVNPDAAPYCSHCGHCSAICPEEAITVTYPGAGPVTDLSEESLPTIGQLSKLIMSRRSVREYKKKKVPKDVFEEIFDIIRYAPTGMNGQSVHWLILQKPEEVRALVGRVIDWARIVVKEQPDHPLAPILPMFIGAWDQGTDRICHGAPHLVFAYSHKDNPVGYVDAVIAMTHLDLTAPVFELGTCWAGIVQIALDSSPELMQSIGLPADHKSHYAMMIGYPRHEFKNIPARNTANVLWK